MTDPPVVVSRGPQMGTAVLDRALRPFFPTILPENDVLGGPRRLHTGGGARGPLTETLAGVADPVGTVPLVGEGGV